MIADIIVFSLALLLVGIGIYKLLKPSGGCSSCKSCSSKCSDCNMCCDKAKK